MKKIAGVTSDRSSRPETAENASSTRAIAASSQVSTYASVSPLDMLVTSLGEASPRSRFPDRSRHEEGAGYAAPSLLTGQQVSDASAATSGGHGRRDDCRLRHGRGPRRDGLRHDRRLGYGVADDSDASSTSWSEWHRSDSFGLECLIGLDRGDDCLDRDAAVGDQLAARASRDRRDPPAGRAMVSYMPTREYRLVIQGELSDGVGIVFDRVDAAARGGEHGAGPAGRGPGGARRELLDLSALGLTLWKRRGPVEAREIAREVGRHAASELPGIKR